MNCWGELLSINFSFPKKETSGASSEKIGASNFFKNDKKGANCDVKGQFFFVYCFLAAEKYTGADIRKT